MFPTNVFLSRKTFIQDYESLETFEQDRVKKALFRLASDEITRGMGLKKIMKLDRFADVWSCKCSRGARILMQRNQQNGSYTAVFAGTHDEYTKTYDNNKTLAGMLKDETNLDVIPLEEYFGIAIDETETGSNEEEYYEFISGGSVFGKYKLKNIRELFEEPDLEFLNEIYDLDDANELDLYKEELSDVTYYNLLKLVCDGETALTQLLEDKRAIRNNNVARRLNKKLEDSTFIKSARTLFTGGFYIPPQNVFITYDYCFFETAMGLYACSAVSASDTRSKKRAKKPMLYLSANPGTVKDMEAFYKLDIFPCLSGDGDPIDMLFATPMQMMTYVLNDLKPQMNDKISLFDVYEDTGLFQKVLNAYKRSRRKIETKTTLADLIREYQYICCRYNAFTEISYQEAPKISVRDDLRDEMDELIPRLLDKMKTSGNYELSYAAYYFRNFVKNKRYEPFKSVAICNAVDMSPIIVRFAQELADDPDMSSTSIINNLDMLIHDTDYRLYSNGCSVDTVRSVIGKSLPHDHDGFRSVSGCVTFNIFDKHAEESYPCESINDAVDIFYEHLLKDENKAKLGSSAILTSSESEAKNICAYLDRKGVDTVLLTNNMSYIDALSECLVVATYTRSRYLIFSNVLCVVPDPQKKKAPDILPCDRFRSQDYPEIFEKLTLINQHWATDCIAVFEPTNSDENDCKISVYHK